MSENQTVKPRALLVPVQGILLPDHIAKDLDVLSAFSPHPLDILLAAYPKSGLIATFMLLFAVAF